MHHRVTPEPASLFQIWMNVKFPSFGFNDGDEMVVIWGGVGWGGDVFSIPLTNISAVFFSVLSYSAFSRHPVKIKSVGAF